MICREEEQKTLDDFLNSDKPEFLAIFGRRRVGKTFLIREFFKKKQSLVFFNSTGSKDGTLHEQIRHFTKIIGEVFYSGAVLQGRKNWDETFELLTSAINNAPKNQKIVLFLDEIPWMATRKSKLLQTLDYYWNQYWSQDKRIKLVVCGSSASWVIEKIINNKGGLHNRITRKILLEPFDLSNTRRFLLKQGVKLNNSQILQLYMITGGVPYYLTHVKKGLSAIQNIEQLAFKKDAMLIEEFNNLFASLFNSHETSIEIIRAIASKRYGMGQEELFKIMKKNIKGKVGLTKLRELEDVGFIMSFKPYLHKKKGIYYRVIDEYVLFYLKWIEPIKSSLLKRNLSPGYWEKQQNSPSWYGWSGLAFESVCYKHLSQITKALKLNHAVPHAWRYQGAKGSDESGTQIDLLFDRSDNAITLCEIKYTDKPFVIDKQYAKNLLNKKEVFIKKTKTSNTKQIFFAMIASSGIAANMYADDLIDGVVTLDDLYQREG